MCEFLPLCRLQDLFVGHEQVLLAPPLPNEFFFFFFLHHLWVFTCQPCTSFILHGNLTPYHCLAPLAIILLCWAFSKIVNVGFMGLLVAICRLCSNCKRASSTHTLFPLQLLKELDNLAKFSLHHRGL